MNNNCNKFLKELESNVKLFNNKPYLKIKDYEIAMSEALIINKIKDLRLSRPISMSIGMMIVHQSYLNKKIKIEGSHIPKDYFKNVYKEAYKLYRLGGKHGKHYNENIINVAPPKPCEFFENNASKKFNHYKKLIYIVMNRMWLIDYIEVAKSLNEIRVEVKYCLDKDML